VIGALYGQGMKSKFKKYYMDVAELTSHLSVAERLQVGAVIVKDGKILASGYNGTPSGWDNKCEIENEDGSLSTKKEVIHAEMNAIAKLARSTESGEGAVMFVTHAPCIECAKLIFQSGISRVYYKNKYRSEEGVAFLKTALTSENVTEFTNG